MLRNSMSPGRLRWLAAGVAQRRDVLAPKNLGGAGPPNLMLGRRPLKL